jgi:hypothetical protein
VGIADTHSTGHPAFIHHPSAAPIGWEMTKKTDEHGYYVLAKHVVVEFVLEEILDLSLNGFRHQNVLFGLTVEELESSA